MLFRLVDRDLNCCYIIVYMYVVRWNKSLTISLKCRLFVGMQSILVKLNCFDVLSSQLT